MEHPYDFRGSVENRNIATHTLTHTHTHTKTMTFMDLSINENKVRREDH